MTYRAVLGDEHPLLRLGLCSLIETCGGEVLGEAATTDQVLQLSAALRPDLVVCADQLEGLPAEQLVDSLGTRAPEVRVLVLDTRVSVESARRMLRAGALGYTAKTARLEEIQQACRSVAAGEPFVHPPMVTALLVEPSERRGGLTDREVSVLRLMHDGLTNPAIASAITISVRTVEATRASIRRKLGTVDRATSLGAARQLGVLTN